VQLAEDRVIPKDETQKIPIKEDQQVNNSECVPGIVRDRCKNCLWRW
jgi:hypothetical protein